MTLYMPLFRSCTTLRTLTQLHAHLFVTRLHEDPLASTKLIESYAQMGSLQSSRLVFETFPNPDSFMWGVLIKCHVWNHFFQESISLYHKMLYHQVQVNRFIYPSILRACSGFGDLGIGGKVHGRIIKFGFYFSLMRNFGIEPNTEHFSVVVDLLSRSGDLNGAYEIIKSMPLPVDASIWGALLNGCRIHQRMDMIKSIKRDLVDISTDDTGYYTLLSNIYAEGGDWNEVRKVRSKMEGIGLTKVPGWSSIELEKTIYRFGAGDSSHLQTNEIYRVLKNFPTLDSEPRYNVENDSSIANFSQGR
ncbi:hypothetical protein F2P56_035950 [Juglans regia]|uniref:Uncharacterized protein n=1 Tax=Juglans regia TaxID=51240 RepID=A0A833WC89_JUGRE|nr:hypothetical protein F2P56_035950 [Juglans regia]